jgi:hypothetical protein
MRGAQREGRRFKLNKYAVGGAAAAAVVAGEGGERRCVWPLLCCDAVCCDAACQLWHRVHCCLLLLSSVTAV